MSHADLPRRRFIKKLSAGAGALALPSWLGGTTRLEEGRLEERAQVRVVDLRCERMTEPLGIDVEQPQLSWQLRSGKRGTRQAAYRVLVAGSRAALDRGEGDLWDSGRVASSQSLHVPYGGYALQSNRQYFWKVRVWSEGGQASTWSPISRWTTGLLTSEDWQAEWIRAPERPSVEDDAAVRWMDKASVDPAAYERLEALRPAVHLRREVTLESGISRATAFICGLGFYELYANGEKVGDHVLDPGQTDYPKRALYATHDLTERLHEGPNALGIILGDGWYDQRAGFASWLRYGRPGVIAQVEVEYKDGSTERLLTNDQWTAASGPIVKNNIYAGEIYDARRELGAWSTAGYDDSEWSDTKEVTPLSPELVSQRMPPIKKIRTVQPVQLLNPSPGTWVFDMGQNFAGWGRLTLEGVPRGTIITMGFAEWSDANGFVNYESTGGFATGVNQTDTYVAKGADVEVWEPRFTYHGFRYVEMTGYPGEPSLDMLEGVVVRTAADAVGTFTSSDPLLNKIHETVLWTFESNLHSIPTDCPHRERCGWLGDAHVEAEAMLSNFDLENFGQKYVRDIQTSTNEAGTPNDIVPGKRDVLTHVDWGVATILLPWFYYVYYADRRLLEGHYDYMRRFMTYFHEKSKRWIVDGGLGDWCDPVAYPGASRIGGRGAPQHTPPVLTSTAYFYQSSEIMRRVATLLGHEEHAASYRRWAEHIKQAFNERFLDRSRWTYNSQTADAFALHMGLVPEGREPEVARSLARDAMIEHNGHYTTGSHGNTRLYSALVAHGYDNVASALFHAEGFPGFKYLYALEGTTFWEQVGGFDPDTMTAPERSLNHPFHGGFDAFFYRGVAGIAPDPEQPGFKHIVMRPGFIQQLESAEATYASPYGPIESRWRRKGRSFHWFVRVPENATATLFIPTRQRKHVTEQGKSTEKVTSIAFSRMEAGRAVFKAGSGRYRFSSQI